VRFKCCKVTHVGPLQNKMSQAEAVQKVVAPVEHADRPSVPAQHRLLTMRDVDKVFAGDVVALSRFNLSVNQGDFISLLGPSGCGNVPA